MLLGRLMIGRESKISQNRGPVKHNFSMCRGSTLCLQRLKASVVKATLTQNSLRGPELNLLSFSQSLYVSVSVHYPLSHPASCFVCVYVCICMCARRAYILVCMHLTDPLRHRKSEYQSQYNSMAEMKLLILTHSSVQNTLFYLNCN